MGASAALVKLMTENVTEFVYVMEKRVSRYSICLINSEETLSTSYWAFQQRIFPFPLQTGPGVPHGCQLICLPNRAVYVWLHISRNVFPERTLKEYLHPHTYSHGGRLPGWEMQQHHLWQLLNHLIFLRLFFFFFFFFAQMRNSQSSAMLADGDGWR